MWGLFFFILHQGCHDCFQIEPMLFITMGFECFRLYFKQHNVINDNGFLKQGITNKQALPINDIL